LFQKLTAGVSLVVFPARGWVPVGVETASSAVSEKSCVSCSKTRGVNEMSPKPVWLCLVVTACPDGWMMGKPVSTLLLSTKGMFVMSSSRRFSGVKSV
jgi:hypothetical protein